MHDPASELPRTYLLRRWMHKGIRRRAGAIDSPGPARFATPPTETPKDLVRVKGASSTLLLVGPQVYNPPPGGNVPPGT